MTFSTQIARFRVDDGWLIITPVNQESAPLSIRLSHLIDPSASDMEIQALMNGAMVTLNARGCPIKIVFAHNSYMFNRQAIRDPCTEYPDGHFHKNWKPGPFN